MLNKALRAIDTEDLDLCEPPLRRATTVALVGNAPEAFRPFRMHLLRTLVRRGHRVVALYPRSKGAIPLNVPGVEEMVFSLDPFAANPLRDLRSVRSLRSRFDQLEPSHVISFTIKPVVYGGIAAAAHGVPNIFSIITGLGYLFTGHSVRRAVMRRYAEALYARALARNSRVFFQNRDDLELFVSRKLISNERAALVPGSGVDTDEFSPRGNEAEAPTFTFIGRLLWDKGIGEFISAARIMKRLLPNARMIVAGPICGNPASVSKRVLAKWQDEGIIEYRGKLSDVRPLISESWAIILPSYREGSSRLIQEALAMGRPVVTCDAPGCRESITNGEHGFIVPTRDPVALSEAMMCIVRSPALRRRMGESSRTRAVECFKQERVTYQLVEPMGL